MNYDFITLHKIGVGRVLVRHSEIVIVEPTHQEFSHISLSSGERMIVEEGPVDILNMIKIAEDLKAQEDASSQDTKTETTGANDQLSNLQAMIEQLKTKQNNERKDK